MRLPKSIVQFYGWSKKVVLAFLDNDCITHAAGLSYFALLAMVPILCCILVAAKACNVDKFAKNEINRQIDLLIENVEDGQKNNFLSMLPGMTDEEQKKKRIAAEEFGRQARFIANTLFERIEKFDIDTFGWIGFGFLLWTVISSLGSVENSFNRIFSVDTARPIWKRAYMYLFIMIVLPILMTVAMSLPILNVVKDIIVAVMGSTWLTKWASDGLIWVLDSSLFRITTMILFSSLSFGFFYWVIPNCRVSIRSAWRGGLIAAVLMGGWLKLCAVAQIGIAKSSVLYGSFAFLPIVLAWVHISCQILLLGACMVRSFEEMNRS